MCQFIDERDAWPPSQDCLRVHLLKCFAAVFDLAMRHHREPLCLLDRVGTRVRLEVGNNHIDSQLRGCVAIGKHLKSLSDARRITQINF
jgi:hypothetical protein